MLFTQIKATPSKKGGFILKLQAKVTKTANTAFGNKEVTNQETYYMKVNQPTLSVGAQAELDISQFRVDHLPYDIQEEVSVPQANGQPDLKVMQKKTIQLKWLFLK